MSSPEPLCGALAGFSLVRFLVFYILANRFPNHRTAWTSKPEYSNEGDVRLAVTDAEVVESWKKFFDRGTNWKDFPKVTSYEEYRKITDKQHLSKAKSMPIKFLKASGKGFFIDKDGYALGIRDELADVIKVDAFKKQMKDIIEYRTMEYYRRRYVEN